MQSIKIFVSDKDLWSFEKNAPSMGIDVISVTPQDNKISIVEFLTNDVSNIFLIGKIVGVQTTYDFVTQTLKNR